MTLIEDYRPKKGKGDDDDDDDQKETSGNPIHLPFEPASEAPSLDDSEAIKLAGKNPLAEEESVEEDDSGGD
jgi:hypothetical protein